MTNDLSATLIELEQKMWRAFATNDAGKFRELVDSSALMVVGGERTTGEEYAKVVGYVKIMDYQLSQFSVIPLGADAALVHYTAAVTGGPGMEDLTGTFLVSSAWVRGEGGWKLVFNQDSTPPADVPGQHKPAM